MYVYYESISSPRAEYGDVDEVDLSQALSDDKVIEDGRSSTRARSVIVVGFSLVL